MHDHLDEPHEHDDEQTAEEVLGDALELDTQSQIFLELRRQNLDLLKLAAEVTGYGGAHAPVKQADLKGALRNIWDVYSEFHAWIDPEESEGDEEEGEEDDL